MQVLRAFFPLQTATELFCSEIVQKSFFPGLLFGCSVAGLGQPACIACAGHAMAISRYPCIDGIFELGQAWYAIWDGCQVEHTAKRGESSINGSGAAILAAGFIDIPGCFHALLCCELDALEQAGRLPRQYVKPIARIQTLHGVRDARSKSAISIKHEHWSHVAKTCRSLQPKSLYGMILEQLHYTNISKLHPLTLHVLYGAFNYMQFTQQAGLFLNLLMMTNTSAPKVAEWIDEHAGEMIETLAELVRTPSVVGHETEAQVMMRDLYLAAGLDVDVFEADRETLQAHSAFVDSGIAFAGRPNVIGVLAGASGGRSLILNGHTDVVSPEPISAWTHDPFGAVILPSPVGGEGHGWGRMYGRGTQDMKSGLIANLFAVRALKECGVQLKGDLILQSVIEEEAGGGGGTLACFQRGYLADGFIATEPHWHDISVAHPGILYFRIVVEGKSAHAGRAHQGVNAAVEAAPIIAMLGEWDKERAATLHYEPFERVDPGAKRSCHLNVGVVRAGDWPSTVPGRCEIEVRMSFVPGETEAGVKQKIEARVQAVAQDSAWLREHPPRIEYFGWHTEPWIQDEQHPFVQSFVQCVKDVREEMRRTLSLPKGEMHRILQDPLPVPMGLTAGLDTRFAGQYGVPAFAWGPKGAGLHGADEYVELDSVIEVARTLAIFAMQWCGIADDEEEARK
jgi:acetylornithine deacetylase